MQLREFLKSQEIKNPLGVYLIYGEENFFVDQLSAALKDLHKATVLWGDEIAVRDLLLLLSSTSFLYKRPVFLIRDAHQALFKDHNAILKLDKLSKERSGAIFFHLSYASSEKDLGELSSLKIPLIHSRRLDQKTLIKLIQDKLSELGITITPQATQELILRTGKDLIKLRFELEKLSSLGIKQIDTDIIYSLLPPEGEFHTLELLDALLGADFDKAYEYSKRAFGASMLILSGLLSITLRLYLTHFLISKGIPKEKAFIALDLKPPLSNKFEAYLKAPFGRVRHLLEVLTLADREIKLNLKDPYNTLCSAIVKFIIYEKFNKNQDN
ncbi:MAG: DNA polymerase III subunit delta [Aquificaceae bacterium]